MIKYLDIRGTRVIDDGGETKGSVLDCIFDRNKRKVFSVVVTKKTHIVHYYILSFNGICSVGDDIISMKALHCIKRGTVIKHRSKMLGGFIDKTVIDKKGNTIGEMKDAIIDEVTGEVKAIICSSGFVDDIMEGRRVILLDKESIFGPDKIIIRDSSINIYNEMSFWKLTKG